MPRANLMSWEGAPYYRWVKMHKGVRYRVSCQDLGAMVFTKEATVSLANKWWQKKLAELEGPSPVAQILKAVEEMPLDRLKEMTLRGEAARALIEELPFVQASLQPDAVAEIVGEAVPPEQQNEALRRVVGRVTESAPSNPARAFKPHAERFLSLVRDKQKPLTFRELRLFVHSLYDCEPVVWADMDIGQLNEAKVEEVFLWLRKADITNPTRKKRWGFFKRLVRYFWESRLIELPRNLDSTAMEFRATAKKIKAYTPAEVRRHLETMPERLRVFALLGLNCGMTAADMGQLRKDQVDLARGRLVRKRVKTFDNENVPEVDYPLWPETVSYLRGCWSGHPELALTSADGTALWESRQEGEQGTPQKDLIYQYFKRAKQPVTVKQFRSISATILESHESYGRYKGHFLGHSPKSVADRHYAAPSGELFDRIVTWLHDQIFKG